MLCCHGVRGDEPADASVSLCLLISCLVRCLSYLEGELRCYVTILGFRKATEELNHNFWFACFALGHLFSTPSRFINVTVLVFGQL